MLVPTNPWVSKMVWRRWTPAGLGDQDEAVAGSDLPPEPDILHPPEADEAAFGQIDDVAVVAGELGGGLAHEDAGHQAGSRACGPRTQNSSASTSL